MFPCKDTETPKAPFCSSARLIRFSEVLNKKTCKVTVNTSSTTDYANCLWNNLCRERNTRKVFYMAEVIIRTGEGPQINVLFILFSLTTTLIKSCVSNWSTSNRVIMEIVINTNDLCRTDLLLIINNPPEGSVTPPLIREAASSA